MTTPYHAAYYAHELTRRSASDSIAKLGSSLFNATVDLNPHQLDAAMFAFRSPLSRGVILADEVGLGKTIEAGLVISQLWAERKRRILVIAPAILRKQWAQELCDKFYIDSQVIDTREFNAAKKAGTSALEARDRVVIASYHFAAARRPEITVIPWDLVVIDEAHRLRNVYKPKNKIANAIKEAVRGRPLMLLTATPLQNDLLELYGLVSVLDEHVFGDIEAFKARYKKGTAEEKQLGDLRERLRPICQRTLRRQVTGFVQFTDRIPFTQDFTPTEAEQKLYDQVSEYLQRESLNALPAGQRKLMTLVLRKLLASSTFAIAGTLEALATRLNDKHATPVPDPSVVLGDFETIDELSDEWDDEKSADEDEPTDDGAPADVQAEVHELKNYGKLAASITVNAKGQALLTALRKGFEKLAELGAPRKAVIFTESRRTQAYLIDLLGRNGYAGRVLTINGVNADDRSGTIYRDWVKRHAGEPVVTGNKTVDLRAALVEHFRDRADILIATEAAAEGVNLQFCSLVVNYDLPWNPQRIEQRIGRCHRYGQKYNVVVINFLNRANAADQRVFELLSEKFRLVRRRVRFIRRGPRCPGIRRGLRAEDRRDSPIVPHGRGDQRGVPRASRGTGVADHGADGGHSYDPAGELRRGGPPEAPREPRRESGLSRPAGALALGGDPPRARRLGEVSRGGIRVRAGRSPGGLRAGPAGALPVRHAGTPGGRSRRPPLPPGAPARRVGRRHGEGARLAHREAPVRLLGSPREDRAGGRPGRALRVADAGAPDREGARGRGSAGLVALDDDGNAVDPDAASRLFLVDGHVAGTAAMPAGTLDALGTQLDHRKGVVLAEIGDRNNRFFEEQIDKLDRWADDLKNGLEVEIKDLNAQIKQVGKDAKLAPDLKTKLVLQTRKKDLESQRAKKQRALFEAQDEIESRKDSLIGEVEARLKQTVAVEDIFTIGWEVV